MTDTVFFAAYPSHPSLRQDIQRLIDNLNAGTRESQKALAAHAFETAAQEVLDALVTNLVRKLENPQKPNAEIHKTIARIRDSMGGLCRMITGVLSNEKLAVAMRHYRTLLLDVDDATGQPQPWIGMRVDSAFVNELRAVAAHLRDDNATYDAQRTMRILDRLTDMVIGAMIEQPKELMGLGFVLRKTADGAIALMRSAMHGMTHRSIPHLSPRQRKGLAEHLEAMLLELPANRFV
jgi:hypothetical protein